MDHVNVNRRDLLRIAGGGIAAAALGVSRGTTALAQEGSPTASASGSLVIGKAQEAVGLDPALVTAASSFQIMAPVYQQLVSFDESGQPQPELAESWENPDDTTFVFHLRDGVTFHNGRPLTAADVKFSFDRILDPATKSAWLSQFEPIASIETPDDRTVRFTLKQPYGPFLATLSQDYAAIVPQDAGDLQATMVGTGPFALAEWTRDTQTVLKAHPNYWEAGLPLVADLTYRILPDEAARLAAIRTGEIGLSSLASPAAVSLASRAEGVQVVTQETTDYYLLGINCQRAPLDNVKVRQALSLAVDRKAVLDAVFFGEGRVTGPIVPTLGDWATPVEQLPLYTQDLDQAKALLAEAGLADGFDLPILASPFYPEFINIALVLQSQLKEVGINVTLDQVEWGTFIDRWISRDFSTFVSYNGSGNDPDRAIYPVFHTGGSVNAFQFSDPEVDRLLDEGRTTVDPAARREIYHQAEALIAQAAPALFLFTRTAYFALRDNVQGFQPTPVDTWDTLKRTSVS
ncbi:MAG: peptide/nickel transport system substrate-binding protein [Thermomicrobiales bacterium]|jgi:peptide/nickel transport system substrate-binding protein|nr:peptide/nickel transport system substrate-binding protein [Thermomicrobiales bacterium]MEA2528718.1 peptide/nickel transport system substrate-binding protein [Thermomicrobiales bacterium]MEA2594982.1 peptide/nickel transport system substrate-binding protein [Thermomicrobiales bacterium]